MTETIELLTLLYELSLTNLRSDDPEEIARKFIRKFISRKNLQYAAAWKLESTHEDSLRFRKIYAMPSVHEVGTLSFENFALMPGPGEFQIFNKSLFEENEQEGAFAYFKLERFGLLELYDSSPVTSVLTKSKLNPFADVMTQFASSLASGYLRHAIHENEEKYRRIIDNVSLGLLEVDNNEVIQFANTSFLKLVGYDLNEIIGQKASELLVDGDDRDKVATENKKRVEGQSSSYEITIRNKNGEKRWAIISGAPNYNEEGELVGSIGIHLDITGLKKLEEENEFKSLQLTKLHELSLDAILSIDVDGKVFEWSPQAEKVFGYTAAEIMGKKISETIIPHQYREAHDNGMDNYHKTGHGPVLNSRIEISAIRKNGEEFPIELTIFPIEHGENKYFTAFIRDITELKQAKESVEKALARQKELNRLKSQFVSMTSHELRTPLTTIIGNAEIIDFQMTNLEKLKPEKVKKNVLRIQQNADRLNQLINNILLMGQLESQKIPFDPEFTIPHEFINDQLLPDYHTREIEIPHHVNGEPKELKLDKKLFTHIITNLVENAIKYSPDSEKAPEVATTYHDSSIEIAVRDYGLGIPEEDQKKLFDSFYRASNVGNIQGTGLGLAIVEEFVKLHGGAIKVLSKVGEGTTFTLYFPLDP